MSQGKPTPSDYYVEHQRARVLSQARDLFAQGNARLILNGRVPQIVIRYRCGGPPGGSDAESVRMIVPPAMADEVRRLAETMTAEAT